MQRLLIIVLGYIVLLAGVVMLFLPGPGLLFIIIGLGILAKEFSWADNILKKVKEKLMRKKKV